MKKRVVCVLLVTGFSVLAGCGKSEMVDTPVSTVETTEPESESLDDQNVEIPTGNEEDDSIIDDDEEYDAIEDLFSNFGNEVLIEIAHKTLDILEEEEYKVTYEPWPTKYMGISVADGSENGGIMACRVIYGDQEICVQYGDDSIYRSENAFEQYYEMVFTDYEDGYFHKMQLRNVSNNGEQIEVMEEHENDEYMQAFNQDCKDNLEAVEIEKSKNPGTDLERYDYASKKEFNGSSYVEIDGYEVAAYKDIDFSDEYLYVEFRKDDHIVATIRNSKLWKKTRDFMEGYCVSRFNYEGALLSIGTYTDENLEYMEDEEVFKYDKYGNQIYYSDICNAGECEYVPTDENYQHIVNTAVMRLIDIRFAEWEKNSNS